MKALESLVKQEDNGIRVWKFVLIQWKSIVKSREQMRRCFKRGEVIVNGTVAEVTKILATNDLVQIKFDSLAAHESIYGREKLDVRYEDGFLAIVVKPSGMTMVTLGFMLPYSLCSEADKMTLEPISGTQEGEEECLSAEDGCGENDSQDDEDDGLNISSNISPTLGQQNRLPCAVHGLEKASNGLVIVAKTSDIRASLLLMHKEGEIRRTFRVICHGAWAGGEVTTKESEHDRRSSIIVDSTALDADCIDAINVAMVTSSNEAGSLSTLDIVPRSPSMGVNIRRYLMSLQHPVVGDSGNTKSLKANRNKGLQSALVKVEFIHPKLGIPVFASLEEPGKFEQLRNREQKACLRRQANDLEELKKGGLDPLSSIYDRSTERPIAYMVGEKVSLFEAPNFKWYQCWKAIKDFCGMRFKVSPATLIPRSSTETLVEAAIALAQDRAVKILDVGTGSGCLLLALLQSLPSATGLGVDISQEALEVAHTNSALHGLASRASFSIGDLGELDSSRNLLQSFDLLVCNPPYLDASKATKLTRLYAGTEYEPPVALFAEKEGYGAYELLGACLLRDLKATGSNRVMARNGHVVLEIGTGMGQRVRAIFWFLRLEAALKDKQGSERCLVFAFESTNLAM
ncbi:hypothetical protein BGX26_010744 [Mortierella sp. AD094]|nr:hypothetical protein BGX26_010744 [Mortierella sp. AD094]